MGGATLVAYVVMVLWIPISFFVLFTVRPSLACASLMVGAVMFLPVGVGIDLRGLPPIGKEEMASLGLLLAGLFRFPKRLARARPGRGLEALVVVLFLGGVGTVLTNGDPLQYGPTSLPALAPYDAVSMGIRDLIRYGIPFFLGRALYQRPAELRDLMRVLACAGVIYSALILFELRFSPQLHRWAYGYHPHSFALHVRSGGYRPMVFMASGLAIALFVMITIVASAALARARVRVFRVSAVWVSGYLSVILVLCKSYAAMGYALFAVPIVALSRPRFQIRIAVALAMLVFAYPLLRAYDYFPTHALLDVARSVNSDRAQSLEFRFDNEDRLLAKASQRSLFGWGGYRRPRVFDEQRGRDQSITDGFWIIVLGNRGLIGFVSTFGLLLVPIFVAARRLRRVRRQRDRLMLSGLALIAAVCAADLLPNGMFTNLVVFISGCLAGTAKGLSTSPIGESSIRRRDRPALDRRRSIAGSRGDSSGRGPSEARAADTAESGILGEGCRT